MIDSPLTGKIGKDYKVRMSIRGHEISADEPVEVGGTDEAAKPGELLLSALASCKLITMNMYASRKGWDFQGATISLHYLEKGDPTIIEKQIDFIGDLDEKQKQRLLDISGRCPVAKMLSKSISFEIKA